MTTGDRLAADVLRHLATTRGPDDPLGSLAGSVLAGQASLREAATHSWHGEAMASAFAAALRERDRMTAAERARFDRDAAVLRGRDGVTAGERVGSDGDAAVLGGRDRATGTR